MQELQDTWKGQISTPAETDLKTNMDTNMVEEVFMAKQPSGNEVVDAEQREEHLQQQQQQQQREDEEVERLQSELHAQLLAQVIEQEFHILIRAQTQLF